MQRKHKEVTLADQPKEDCIQIETRGYEGAFPWRMPTLQDEISIGAEQARISEGIHVDMLPSAAKAAVFALAYMRVLSTPPKGQPDTRPNWWFDTNQGAQLSNSKPIQEYFAAGGRREATFLGSDEDTGSDAKNLEGSEQRPDPDPESAVGDEVSATPQRREVVVSHRKGAS